MSPDTRPFRPVVLPALAEGGPARATAVDERAERTRAAGYAAGWAAGARAAAESAAQQQRRFAADHERALADRRAATERALAVLARAAQALDQRSAPVVRAATAQVAESALTLARAVVGHELSLAEGSARSVVARVLDLPDDVRPAVVRVAPADLVGVRALLDEAGSQDLAAQLVADPTLSAGDLVVEHATGEVDARIASALARAAAVLLEDM